MIGQDSLKTGFSATIVCIPAERALHSFRVPPLLKFNGHKDSTNPKANLVSVFKKHHLHIVEIERFNKSKCVGFN